MKKKLILFFSSLVLVLCLIPAIKAAAVTYYETSSSEVVPIWSNCYSSSTLIAEVPAKGYVLKADATVTNDYGNKWYKLSSGSYGGKSLAGCYVYSGNVKSHTHDYSGNGGVCKNAGCGVTYGYSVSSMSGYYQVSNSSGAKIWSIPYSTGKSVLKRTAAYNSVVQVTGKTTNAEGNVWYKLSDGNWVYSGNVKAHTHDYSSNGGVCKYSGCGYTYPLNKTAVAYSFQVTNKNGASLWSAPYSTGASVHKKTLAYGTVVTSLYRAVNAEGNTWYYTDDGGWIYSGNLTRRYFVSYSANGGSNPPSTQVKLHGYEITVSGNIPTRKGYIFKYWCSKSDGSGDQYMAGRGTYSKNADATLYAIWEKCTSHDYEGGICTKCKYEYPLTITTFNATFKVTNSGGATSWNRPYSYNATKITLYSQNTILTVNAKTTNAAGNLWYRLTDGSWVYSGNLTQRYTITYNANGGSNAPAAQYKLKGTKITLSSAKPTRVGYIFHGWNTKSDGSGTSYNEGAAYSSNANLTLYAVWTKCTTHDYEGGICTKCKYEYPLTITTMNALFKVTNANGTTVWSRPYSHNSKELRISAKNTVLTVNAYTVNQPGNRWYRLTDGNWVYSGNVTRCYKVNYVLNGGTNNSANPAYYVVGASISLKNPTRAGYTFAGWYLDSGFSQSLKSASVETLLKLGTGTSVSVYAKWTANTYSIAFNGNGATSGSMSAKTATYGTALTLPSNSFKRTGYSFTGWNTKADGSGASYANGASVKNLSATKGATVTLYAQWKYMKPVITTQPSSATIAVGGTATFKVVASGSGLSYQWQYSTDGGKTWQNSTTDGCTTASFSVKGIMTRNGLRYRCIVKNSYGSVTSSAAKLTVMEKPSITSQPSSATVALNGTAKFTLKAAGTGITYQWQYSSNGGKTWQDSTLSGCTSSTLPVVGKEARNGLMYRCVVKNAVGKATSNAVTLTVSKVKPVIRIQPSSTSVALGNTVYFTVKAGGTGLSYQWQYSSDGGKTWQNSTLEGSKTATLPVKGIAARNGLYYRCIVKNSYGSATSSAAKLTVK